mgnify:CR=1 FL=1
MLDWLNKISNFFVQLVKDIFNAILDFLKDVVIFFIDFFLKPIFELVAAIPIPSALDGITLGNLISNFPPSVLYVASQMQLDVAFGMLSAAVLFRLTRKLFTLGQW